MKNAQDIEDHLIGYFMLATLQENFWALNIITSCFTILEIKMEVISKMEKSDDNFSNESLIFKINTLKIIPQRLVLNKSLASYQLSIQWKMYVF